MQEDLIKARLNLCAVLQNIEELVRLDEEMAQLSRNWDISIQFAVRNGPAASLSFQSGNCVHRIGMLPNPVVKLFFLSPGHLNAMFDGKGVPIPLRGFTRLGFMQRDFARLTERLSHYLKPDAKLLSDPEYVRINTIMTLNTAIHAVRELALLEPLSKQVAGQIPPGTLQVDVLPDGPHVNITFGPEDIVVRKASVEKPTAKMVFKNLETANALLTGKLDAFLAVAQGDVLLQGQLPIIDNMNLILDRVPLYLS